MEPLDVLVVLDRSGSMQHAKEDHEGGLRSFVNDQKNAPGDVRFTLIQFDSVNPCEVIYDRAKLDDVRDIVLIPRGWTPLLDAFGRAVEHLSKLNLTNVVCMVITDGQENASREWTRERIKAMVKELDAKGWTFLFLGANIDSFAEAGSMGVAMAGVMDFNNDDSAAVRNMYSATSANTLRSRGAQAQGQSVNSAKVHYNYTDDQKAAAKGGTTTSGGVSGTVSSSGNPSSNKETKG